MPATLIKLFLGVGGGGKQPELYLCGGGLAVVENKPERLKLSEACDIVTEA